MAARAMTIRPCTPFTPIRYGVVFFFAFDVISDHGATGAVLFLLAVAGSTSVFGKLNYMSESILPRDKIATLLLEYSVGHNSVTSYYIHRGWYKKKITTLFDTNP